MSRMLEGVEVGDRLWHINLGWVEVVGVHLNSKWEIEYMSPMSVVWVCNLDGKTSSNHKYPSLYWDEIKIEIPNRPLPNLDVDTPMIVWNNGSDEKYYRYFARWRNATDGDRRVVCFGSGATSWSAGGSVTTWDNWEIYQSGEKDDK